MRDRELIPMILAASGAQSVLVWAASDGLHLGTEWRSGAVELAELVGDIVRSGVRGYVNSDDARIRKLALADVASCGRYFVATNDDVSARFVLLGFTDGEDAPQEAIVGAIVRLASLAAGPPATTGTTELHARDVADIMNGSAHAVGTPLNVISGTAEAILRSSAEDSPHRRSLDMIVEQAHRVGDTVRRAVAIVGREPALKTQPVSWPELVADTLAMSSAMLKRLECRARWTDASNEATVVTVDIPGTIGDLFIILRGLAERVGPKGILVIRRSTSDTCAIEIEGLSSEGATVDVVAYAARQSAAASSSK